MSDGHNKRLTNLERDVANLRKAVNGMRKQDVGGIAKQEHANQESNATAVPILIERTPRDTTQAADPAKQSKRLWKRIKWKPTLEIAGIVAGIGYATVTFFQWRDANRNFENGQRAWVLPASISLPLDERGNVIDFSTTEARPITLTIKNFGLSPSLDTWSDVVPEVSGSGCAPIIFSSSRSHATLGPGLAMTFPNIAVSPVDPKCLEALHDGSAKYRLSGYIHYSDIFHREHHSRVCVEYDGRLSHRMAACQEDNSDTN